MTGATYAHGEALVKSETAVYSVTWSPHSVPDDPNLIGGLAQLVRAA